MKVLSMNVFPYHRLMVAVFLACSGAAASAAEAFVLARDGKAAAALVILPNSGKMAEDAAGDLAVILKRMTGASFESGSTIRTDRCVVVGLASEWAALTKDTAPLKRLEGASPESFLLQSTPGRLLILGRDSNGASHGVYTVLRDLGCRWYFITKDWEVIPSLKDVAVSADRVEGPAMKVRILSNGAGAGASGKLFTTWSRRNRLGSAYGPQAVSHSYAAYVPKGLFKEHPEYFAWVSDPGDVPGTKQNGEQPCTTQPEVLKQFLEGVPAALRWRQKNAGSPPPLISVSPNDGTLNMCRCPRCLAVGTYGDCALLLANQVAEAIHTEFPTTLVGFLAYGRAGVPPVNVKQAHSNVLVCIAAGFNWKTSVPRLLEVWPTIARHVTVYEYYAIGSWGSQEPDNNLPNVAHISQTVRRWHETGIEGVNGEMQNDWATCGHRLWAFAEFSWNPALAPEAALEDFYTKCWGEAAGPMRRYYGRWESGQKASPRVLRLALKDLEEAARLARAPQIVRRVDQMSLYFYWNLLTRAFKETTDEADKNRIALEGDLFQYRWREAFMVQLVGGIFNVDRPVRLDFSPAEVAALRAASLTRFLPATGPDIDLNVGTGWEDLVPAKEGQKLAPPPAGERDSGFLNSASYLFRAKAGERVQVVFEQPGGSGSAIPMEDVAGEKLGRFQLWYMGSEGKAPEFVLEKNTPPVAGRPLLLEFKAEKDGLYRLNAKVQQTGGGVRADFKGRPHVLAAVLKPSKYVLALSQVADPKVKGGSSASIRFYIYVPKGTRAFLVDAESSGRKQVRLTFKTAAGQGIAQVTADSGAECLVSVPQGRDGAIWSLSLDADHGQLGLAGIPPWVAVNPGEMMIPREK